MNRPIEIPDVIGRDDWNIANEHGRPFVVYKFAATAITGSSATLVGDLRGLTLSAQPGWPGEPAGSCRSKASTSS